MSVDRELDDELDDTDLAGELDLAGDDEIGLLELDTIGLWYRSVDVVSTGFFFLKKSKMPIV